MKMAIQGTWRRGDTVTYVTGDGRRLTGKVADVVTKRVYTVIPEGTLGAVDVVEERLT